MSDKWFIRGKSKEYGPYDLSRLKEYVSERKLRPDTYLRLDGSSEWIPAKQVHGLFSPETPSSSEKEQADSSLINMYWQDYNNTLRDIDSDVAKLIQSGKDFQAIFLMGRSLGHIMEIYTTIGNFYSLAFNYQSVLKRFGSTRLKQLGIELIPTFEILREGSSRIDYSDQQIERDVVKKLNKLGYKKEHWFIKDRIFLEIEYMFYALNILVEPDFVPLGYAAKGQSDEADSEFDRHILAAVKRSVWRRDQGKCVNCGSQEKLEYDHIIPVSKGGSNTERNIQLLCEKCNREKAAKIA